MRTFACRRYGPADAAHPLHEQPERGEQQQPRVERVRPEQRPGRRHRRPRSCAAAIVRRRGKRGRGPGRGQREQAEHDGGLDAEQRDRAPAQPPAGRVLPDEHPQRRRDRHDPDELQVRPRLRGRHAVGRELDRRSTPTRRRSRAARAPGSGRRRRDGAARRTPAWPGTRRLRPRAPGRVPAPWSSRLPAPPPQDGGAQTVTSPRLCGAPTRCQPRSAAAGESPDLPRDAIERDPARGR